MTLRTENNRMNNEKLKRMFVPFANGFGDDGFGHRFGNNAQPINDGRCCDGCNSAIVIPARINQIALARNNRHALADRVKRRPQFPTTKPRT